MKNQSNPKRFLSLHLVAGLLVFATMTLTLGEISEDVINREPLTVADVQLSTWLHTHAVPYLTSAMLVSTRFGSTLIVSCIAAGFAFYLLWQRRFYWLAAALSSVFGGMLLKYAFHRARPHFNDPILSIDNYSFPSGHTMMATVLYGVLAAYLFSRTTDLHRRALIIIAAGFLIALVGFSRMYLGVHYLSDVLAAIAEGLAWLSLCGTMVYSVWRREKNLRAQNPDNEKAGP
jgi:membrane-associated phospholipid phosphatase